MLLVCVVEDTKHVLLVIEGTSPPHHTGPNSDSLRYICALSTRQVDAIRSIFENVWVTVVMQRLLRAV